jgi:hypothetical protein
VARDREVARGEDDDVDGRRDVRLKIEIDLGLSPGAKKWSVRLGVPVVLLVAGGVAFAGLPGGYADGQPLTKAELDANFNYLQGEITPLAAQTPMNLFLKVGNNGTVTCDSWCENSGVGSPLGMTGTCVGAQRGDNAAYVACTTSPGTVASPMSCWCAQP